MATTIEPEVSLALSIAGSPGVYALLLGSGVSRGAGIPTGWEVVEDLARRIANADGADAGADPIEWFRSQFGEDPTYPRMLAMLGRTPAERQAILKRYFEPNEDERERGLKVPSIAHHAIAQLVVAGRIRVIVTTNFDRLLEGALEAKGIAPTVISTPDQAKGSVPLTHSKCTILKLHGDYLDTRIRNSPGELRAYDRPFRQLTAQILDEYGLVVRGWSAEYDEALRGLIESSPSRRYTTYWCVRGEVADAAQRLIAHRSAEVLQVSDADSFFARLAQRVGAIVDSERRDPAETRIAVELLKRYVPEPGSRIRLRELIADSTERLVANLNRDEFPPYAAVVEQELPTRVAKCLSYSEQTLALIANGCYWGEPAQADVWVGAVKRLAELERPLNGRSVLIDLCGYPALLHFYTAGIAAILAANYQLLAAVLLVPIRSQREESAAVQAIYPHHIVPEAAAHVIYPHPDGPKSKWKTPLSQHLHSILRDTFRELVVDDREYDDAFNRFEYICSLTHGDLHQKQYGQYGFAGGSFEWREGGRGWLPAVVDQELERLGANWPALQAGLFGGSLERLREVKSAVDEVASRRRYF